MPIPFLVRLPFAVALVVWGARTDRKWVVPVASMIALPALWYGGLSMVLGTIPLRRAALAGPGWNPFRRDSWGSAPAAA